MDKTPREKVRLDALQIDEVLINYGQSQHDKFDMEKQPSRTSADGNTKTPPPYTGLPKSGFQLILGKVPVPWVNCGMHERMVE